VGSTLFQNLTDVVLSQEIVQTFVRLGYNRLIVQYGSGTIPRNVSESQGNIHIETIDYIKDIDTIMEESDLIISHAGSGSILSGLRMGKKMVIIPNTKLMDNHQVELAEALNQDGYLLVSSPS
jgi:beta-1,4-N-acetylglucosaminyltransferase